MSGEALAKFRCGAVERRVGRTVVRCGRSAVARLSSNGQQVCFIAPLDWHVELGLSMRGSDTVVRCPAHTRWVNGQGWVDEP